MNKIIGYFDRIMHKIVNRYLIKYLEPSFEETLLRKHHVYGDPALVTIAKTANVNNGLFNVASGKIVIEDYVMFGHNVCIITGTHDFTKFNLERQQTIPSGTRDIIIRQGAWVSSNVTILGPCEIGAHAVIGACSLVNKNVPPYAIVGGMPARLIKTIPHQ